MTAPAPVVLLVDDDLDALAMYTLGLLAMGFDPVTAQDAEHAFVRACELGPDAIVTDVTLPGASGLDLMRRLREDARTRGAGLIALTGHASRSVTQGAAQAGCDRCLLKPCLPDELAQVIRDVLAARRTPPTSTAG